MYNFENCNVLFNVQMKDYTTFKTGGTARVLIEPETPMAVAKVLRTLTERGEKYYVLGNGSNLLVADEGIDAAVIHIGRNLSEVRVEGESVICQAGALLSAAANAAYKNALTGLEFAQGIPGSVGGGVCMNAGAYGGELKDVIDWIDYALPSGEVCRMDCDTADLTYRHSFFSDKPYVVTAACFKLKNGDSDAISGKMKELAEKRRDKQPLEYPSAGSTFKRPVGGFAAALIEEAGLKGTSCGDACVSEKHSGFIVNKGNATTGDILNLMETVKEKVFEKSGIMLEPEVKFWK